MREMRSTCISNTWTQWGTTYLSGSCTVTGVTLCLEICGIYSKMIPSLSVPKIHGHVAINIISLYRGAQEKLKYHLKQADSRLYKYQTNVDELKQKINILEKKTNKSTLKSIALVI